MHSAQGGPGKGHEAACRARRAPSRGREAEQGPGVQAHPQAKLGHGLPAGLSEEPGSVSQGQ